MNFSPLFIMEFSACHVNWHASITYMFELAYWGLSAPVVHEPNEWRKLRPRGETCENSTFSSLSLGLFLQTDVVGNPYTMTIWGLPFDQLQIKWIKPCFLLNKKEHTDDRCCYGFIYAALLRFWHMLKTFAGASLFNVAFKFKTVFPTFFSYILLFTFYTAFF